MHHNFDSVTPNWRTMYSGTKGRKILQIAGSTGKPRYETIVRGVNGRTSTQLRRVDFWSVDLRTRYSNKGLGLGSSRTNSARMGQPGAIVSTEKLWTVMDNQWGRESLRYIYHLVQLIRRLLFYCLFCPSFSSFAWARQNLGCGLSLVMHAYNSVNYANTL